MPGLVQKTLQRIGIGGVPRLGLLGLRHLQFVEDHHLKLLGRTEVDLFADDAVGSLGGIADLVAELALQFLQERHIDGDTGAFQLGEHPLHRKLHPSEQRRGIDAGEFFVERIGEVHHRAGAQQQRLHRLLIDAFVVIQE